jgi:hypothetical protein
MAIIITSAGTHSLKVNNSAASPQASYLCNLDTVSVVGDVYQQAVNLQNSNGQVMAVFPVSELTTVAASSPASWTLQNAIQAVASLVTS